MNNNNNLTDAKASWLDSERRKFSEPKSFAQYTPISYYKPQVQRREVSQEMLHFIKDSFKKFDSQGKGYLNRQDLKISMLSLMGIKPTQIEIDVLIPKENSSDTSMNLEKFTQTMIQKLTLRDLDEEIRQIFLELDSSCTGFITLSDFKKICSQSAPSIKSTTIEQIFREADSDFDGRISFRDFDKIMKSNIE